MSKNHQENGMIPGGVAVAGADDFSDGESTPLTQDYGDRYVINVSLQSNHGIRKPSRRFASKNERHERFLFVRTEPPRIPQ